MITLNDLITAASFLIGDSPKGNPEYARAIVELIGDVIPGETDDSQAYVMSLLCLRPEDLTV